MFFKFARETLFPSPSPHLVRSQEVHVLHRFLAPHADTTISIPMTLWKFINHTATLDVRTDICLGGHVYRIAEYLQVVPATPFHSRFASQTTLHEQCLVRAGFIYSDPLQWRFMKDHAFALPSAALPPLTQFADSYLIAGAVPRYTVDPPLHPPPRPHALSMRDRPGGSSRPSSSAAVNEEDSEDESEVSTTLGRVESKLDQVLTNQTLHSARLDHIEQNLERSGYPWYDFAYRSHMVSESMPTPTWYPRHDNLYEVSLSHGFDRLRVGRRRFNNFTPPAPRAGFPGDDMEGEEEGDEEGAGDDVDPDGEGFVGDD